jgi:hypothetical protein
MHTTLPRKRACDYRPSHLRRRRQITTPRAVTKSTLVRAAVNPSRWPSTSRPTTSSGRGRGPHPAAPRTPAASGQSAPPDHGRLPVLEPPVPVDRTMRANNVEAHERRRSRAGQKLEAAPSHLPRHPPLTRQRRSRASHHCRPHRWTCRRGPPGERLLLTRVSGDNRQHGAGSREPCGGSRKRGAGSQKPGAGSRKRGAGSQKPGAGSRDQRNIDPRATGPRRPYPWSSPAAPGCPPNLAP